MLTTGQILTICSTKYVCIASIALFEIGSLMSGIAPSIHLLILGRAISGCGAAGYHISLHNREYRFNNEFTSIFNTIFVIIAEVTRLEHRPILFGTFGAMFAIASAAGPLLGGAFTGKGLLHMVARP